MDVVVDPACIAAVLVRPEYSTPLAGAGQWNSKSFVIRRGMIHFRRPAVRNHPAVCFLPVGQCWRFLCPVNNGCFAAPVNQLWHSLAVRWCHHESTHGRFVFPRTGGPECAVRIIQGDHPQVSRRAPRLQRRNQSVVEEARKESQRTNSKSCCGYERHLREL